MGCCCCSSRATAIVAAIFSLLQGSAWLGAAISGLLLYQCSTVLDYGDLTGSGGTVIDAIAGLFVDLLTLTYFYNDDCLGNRRPAFAKVSNGTHDITVVWSNTTQPAVETTYTWMLTYTVLSSIWIAASILLLIIAVSNKKGHSMALLYTPWIITTLAIIVADVVASVTFFLDINKTWGILEYLKFLGAQNVDNIPGNLLPDVTVDVLTAIPSIFMGLIFARGGIIWIANLSFFFTVIGAARKTSKGDIKPSAPSAPSAHNNSQPWLQNSNNMSGQTTPSAQQPRQLRFQEPPPTMPKPQRNSTQYYQAPPQQPYRQPQQEYYPQQNQQPFQQSAYPQQQKQPYQSMEYPQKPQQSYYNEGYEQSEPVDPRMTAHQELKPQMLLQREPMRNIQRGPPVPQKPASALKRTDSSSANNELRSQLPWSYVQHRDEPINVILQQKIDEEVADAPPIPIPDYTLHFPRRPRADNPRFSPNTPTSNNTSKGYDVLY